MTRLKISHLRETIAEALAQGKYWDTRHAMDRKNTRRISQPEILYVLKNGYHEKKKDQFDEHYQAWNYSVRGKTIDQRTLRVIVSFDLTGMLIITAIELKKEGP